MNTMSVPYVWHPSHQAFDDRPNYVSGRVYDSKGFAVPAEHPHYQMMRDGYRHGARVNPNDNAYWNTELQDNPLGLANMHIKAEEQTKQTIARPSSRNQAHSHIRNSYPPKSNERYQLDSSTRPIMRDPSPTYLRHHDRGHMPEIAGQQGSFDAQVAGVDYDLKRQQRAITPASTHRDRNPLRRSTEPTAYDRSTAAYGGRSGIPANAAGFGESSASAYEQVKAQVRAGVTHRTSNARPMERSRTMPVRSSRDADLEGPPILPRPYHYGKEPGARPRDLVSQDYLQEPAAQMTDGFGGDQTDLTRVRDWVNDAKRHTVDGLEHMRPEEYYGVSRHGHRDTMKRQGSAPASAQVLPGSGHAGVNGIHEEPEDLIRYREPVDDYSSDSSSSGSDNQDEGTPHRSRNVRSGKGTPFPPIARRLTADNDELVYGQDGHRSRRSSPYSGSSRSKRSAGKQSSHTSTGKHSFEREREIERETAEKEADKATEGDESATSYEPSIFAKGPQIDYIDDVEEPNAPTHSRPPITPERKHRDYVSRDADRSRSPYAPAHHYAEPAVAQPQPQGYSSASGSSRKLPRSGAHQRSPSYAPQPQTQAQNTTPARLAYLYRGTSTSPSPHGHVRSASVQPQQTHYSSASQDVLKVKRNSRSPSPYAGHSTAAAGNEYFEPPPLSHPIVASNGTPTRQGHLHSHKSSSASAYAHAQAQARTPTHTVETPIRDGRRRSSSRAAYSTPTHPSSHSQPHTHTYSTAAAASAPQTRHVRYGLWNRRGDHLTESGYVVYCPPGRNFPADLAHYPDNAFMDHYGKIARARVENYPELPESVPKALGRTPEKGYDSFIKYVLMPGR